MATNGGNLSPQEIINYSQEHQADLVYTRDSIMANGYNLNEANGMISDAISSGTFETLAETYNPTFEDAYMTGRGREWYEHYTSGRTNAESYESYLERRGLSADGSTLLFRKPENEAAIVDGSTSQSGQSNPKTEPTTSPAASSKAGTASGVSNINIENKDVLSYEEWSKLQDLGHGTFENYGNYLESQGIDTASLGTVYEDGTGKGFSSTVEELLPDSANTGFDTDVISDVITRLGNAAGVLEAPLQSAKTIAEQYDALNEDLRTKLAGEIGSGTELQIEIERTINFMNSFTLDLKSDLESIQTKIQEAEGALPEGGDPNLAGALGTGGASGGYSGSSSASDGSSSAGDIGGIPGTDNTPNVFIESAVVGTLTFSTIVPLFEELGKPSTIQSSLTGEYDVVGIFQHEGKYYYRIYDKNLKKFYYAEIDNNSNFTTDYAEVLKMNEDAMMLSSPDIGQNVLTKMTDINEVYFVNGTLPGQGDSSNITFANILDGMDGKNYYVPLSDSVEMVTLDVFKAGILGDTTTPDTNASTGVSNNVG